MASINSLQRTVLCRLADGWLLHWEPDSRDPWSPSRCCLYRFNGRFLRIRPATLRALERRGLVRLTACNGNWTAELTDAGRQEVTRG